MQDKRPEKRVKKMKVAVLMGGKSHEREFSLASGKSVCDALEAAGHEVLPLDTNDSLTQTLRSEKPDVVYSALHGKNGEDGTIQMLCKMLDIPMVGCKPSVCRQTWNKSVLHSVLSHYYGADPITCGGAAVPISGVFMREAAFKDMGAASALDKLIEHIPGGFPVAVKPTKSGSAMGVSKANNEEELAQALLKAFSFCSEVVVDEWIDGVNLAVAVLGEGDFAYALPPVEIAPKQGFFDTEARLDGDMVDCYAPVRLESLSDDESEAHSIRSEIERAACDVHNAYSCRDLSRVDIIWDGARARVLEIDVSPGMGPYSGFPMACKAAGLSLQAVLNELVEQAALRG